jgi:hypothetical protein
MMQQYKVLIETEDMYGTCKTTHPMIDYDTLTEQFIVQLNADSWVEVFGMDRFNIAIEIADYFISKGNKVE